ncbi:MAG: fused MFS/spermidine synthase [Planctomycetota bacterium]
MPSGRVEPLPASGRWLVTVVYAMALLSGMAALVYEVTWARMLALTFGSTTLAAAAVVAGFMGGMGLGAWLYHRLAHRVGRPLLAYALLEIGIGLTAAALTALFAALPVVLARASEVLGAGPTYDAVRFVAILALLIVPSLLMGATFPALCTIVIRTAAGVDRHLGGIYGVNTVGAALGTLLAGFVLIDGIGLTGAVYVAVVVNLGVAAGALALLRVPAKRADAGSASPEVSAIPTTMPRGLTGVVLVTSGFCTLAYEILWFRALRYTFGTSTYALTTVLFTFLLGLGLGALLLRPVARRRSPEGSLALCQAGIAVLGLAAMAGLHFLPEMPALFDRVSIYSGEVRFRPWIWRLTVNAGVATATMFPATVLMGLSFPLATRLFLGDVRALAARVGTAYLLANIGSVLGAIAGAALLLPLFGTIGATKVCAAANAALAVAIILVVRRAGLPRLAVQGAAVIALVLAILLPGAVAVRGERMDEDSPGNVIFNEEGDLATVQILEDERDRSRRVMTVDGCSIGWSDGYRGSIFYRKQLLLAHLPMVLDRRITHTLNVGLGSASTLAAVASYPYVETLDCVEINAAVVEASRRLPESSVLDDTRARLVVDDVLHYLLRAGPKYDLIVSDGKQHPLHSGNAVMLCREYYELAMARLTDDGILAQWIPLGTLHDDFQMILRTFCRVFPYADVFYFPPESVIVVGAKRPLAGRPLLTADAYRALPVGRDLGEHFLGEPAALVGHWVAGKGQLEVVLDDGPTSTWNHLRLDASPYRASQPEWAQATPSNLLLLAQAGEKPAGADGPTFTADGERYRRSCRLLRVAQVAVLRGDRVQARAFAEQAIRLNPADGEARFFLQRHFGGAVP